MTGIGRALKNKELYFFAQILEPFIENEKTQIFQKSMLEEGQVEIFGEKTAKKTSKFPSIFWPEIFTFQKSDFLEKAVIFNFDFW